jgi:UDP-glucose 4-epimerase
VFNVGGTTPVSLVELAGELVKLYGEGEFVVRAYPPERRKIDIGDYYADDRAIREALGWRARTKLREALRRTLDYYRAEGAFYL